MPKPVIGGAAAVAILLILAMTVACRAGVAENDEVVVLAAASLTEVLDQLGKDFERETGLRVRFSYGASDTLAGQVEKGAPADAVVFAGEGPLASLEESGLTIAGSRRDIASNRLVVVVQRGSDTRLLRLAGLADSSGKVAIADPQLAPAGRYARAALEEAGVWRQLEPRIIPGLDVRNAAAAVTSGNARFGIIYQTDAAVSEELEVVLVVPQDLHPPIVYPAAVVARSRRGEAAGRFLEYLGSAPARDVFGRHGFLPPP
jgi:molybdate transport system substrate-binding protein